MRLFLQSISIKKIGILDDIDFLALLDLNLAFLCLHLRSVFHVRWSVTLFRIFLTVENVLREDLHKTREVRLAIR